MQRDQRLQQLSREHHHALVLARRATRASSSSEIALQRTTWVEVTRRHREELEPHFELEERYLLPAVEKAGADDLARRTSDDHAKLRQLARDNELPLAERLARFGSLLRDHVRFEERELFVFLQREENDALLEAAAEAMKAGR